MKTIHFNDLDFADERSAVEPLTLEEENRVIEFLNDVFEDVYFSDTHQEELTLLQRLIWNYENLCHLRAYTNNGKEFGLASLDKTDPLP